MFHCSFSPHGFSAWELTTMDTSQTARLPSRYFCLWPWQSLRQGELQKPATSKMGDEMGNVGIAMS